MYIGSCVMSWLFHQGNLPFPGPPSSGFILLVRHEDSEMLDRQATACLHVLAAFFCLANGIICLLRDQKVETKAAHS